MELRILFFIDHLRPDGSQTVLFEICRVLRDWGADITVCELNHTDASDCGRFTELPIKLLQCTKLRLMCGVGLMEPIKELISSRPTVVFTALFYADIIGKVLAKMFRIPIVITSLQAQNLDYSTLRRLVSRLTMRLATDVLVPSGNLVESAIEIDGAQPDRIHIVPYSFPPPVASGASKQELRLRLGVPGTAFLVGTAGRLVKQKGHDLLIMAVALLPRADVFLVIAGVGEDEQKLKELALAQGIADRVLFLGFQEKFDEFLGVLDIYAHPSRFEGVPIAVLSAMAAGCPVVVSALAGLSQHVRHRSTGLVVPIDDHVALAEALRTCIGDEDLRNSIAREGQYYILNACSSERMVRSILDIISERRTILERRR